MRRVLSLATVAGTGVVVFMAGEAASLVVEQPCCSKHLHV